MNRIGAASRPTFGPWAAGLVLAAVVVALAAAAARAEEPAEGGFERPALEHPRLQAVGIFPVVLLALFAALVFYVCNWTFLDTRMVNTDRALWGGLVLAGGAVGLAAAVLVPLLLLGLPLGLVLFGGAAAAYAVHRNALVTPPLRVLTGAHLARLTKRRGGRRAAEGDEGPVTGAGRDILFMGLDDLPIRLEGDSQVQRQANREVERILYEAVVRRASTLGVLVRPQKAEVRMRVSGEMVPGGDVERPASEHLAASFKRLAGVDPNETRRPQEGRLRAVVAGQAIELRIKTAGTVRGEQVAVRLVDAAASQMRLEDLGLPEESLESLQQALAARPGLVILSSPKDSGLTTTLHACLRHIDRYINNVVLFGQHADVEVENVQHVVVNQEDGPVASAEVRSRVRMEPDVIAFDSLYGAEIAQVLSQEARDRTVILGIRAADTSQALTRVAALFGSAAPLAERLQIVVNQRVVRLLCPDCREAYRPNPEFLRKANLGSRRIDVLFRPPTASDLEQRRDSVCPRCRNDRYVGRKGLFEVMAVDAEARAMIGRGATVADLRTYARKMGMRNLQEEGLQLVIDGDTSIEEVQRAIQQET